MNRNIAFEIDRPRESDWPAILAVLEGANFGAIGSSEIPEFPLSDCFVARMDGGIVGVAGYRILSATEGKTTLLAVRPDLRGRNIGSALQEARLDHMKSLGVKRIFTNTDDPRVVRWACRVYGFRETGQIIPKTHPFGNPEVDHWTNLVLEM